jgi:hypothetical protein
MLFDKVVHFGSNNQHVKFHAGEKEALMFFKGDQFQPTKGKFPMHCLYSPNMQFQNSFFINDYKV